MTDLELQEENFPNYEQSLVFGNDKSGKKALIYIPISFGIRLGDGNILIESNYNLDFIEITYINGEDGDCTDLYLIVGLMIDDIETNIFFGFFTKSDNKYIIYHNKCFCISSIYNRDIQQPECLKFLGNFTWAICLQNEIRFIQIMQNLRDAFADPRTWRYEYMSIIHSGAIFDTKSIDFDLIKPFFNRGYHYSIVDTSSYSIEIYGDEIMIFMNKIKKINYSDLPDIGGTLSIEILFDEKELPSNFRCSFSEDDKKDVVQFSENIMRFNE